MLSEPDGSPRSRRTVVRRRWLNLGVAVACLAGVILSACTTENANRPATTSQPSNIGTTATSSPDGTTRPSTTTAVPAAVGEEWLVLGGLGPVRFGTSEADALAQLTQHLGPPDEETGWVERACGAALVREVRWSRLMVVFRQTDAGPIFASWFYSDVHVRPGDRVTVTATMPGGLGILEAAEPSERLATRVREAFPTARVDAPPPSGSDNTSWIVQEGEHKVDLYLQIDAKGAVIREVAGIFIRPDLVC